MLKIFFFVFYKIAIQFCGNAKQNPGCIAVTAFQNFKSIFSLEPVMKVAPPFEQLCSVVSENIFKGLTLNFLIFTIIL